MSGWNAAILGMVEGLTEFLPVSSTGHLILVSSWLGLYADPETKAGVNAFEIVIQSGALLAVMGIYFTRLRSMLRGALGQDPAGRNLLLLLLTGFLPAAVIGFLAAGWIKAHLFGIWPVIIALATGGVVMIFVERWRSRKRLRIGLGGEPEEEPEEKPLQAMTVKTALIIGFAQCLAMWPGTSRSMVTIVTARMLGFAPKAAAEFSFLLALPTLGGATAHDLLKEGPLLLQASGWQGLAIGMTVSCLVAWIAVKGFLAYLNRHGMEVFGWYRIALAGVLVIALNI
ncbi:MAG: undecaprenyl-diphosphate phosphatase [Desulfuromonadales bacterium]|nr:undecaprenyl-diphosphate phosphatase [Desulfuromonadales bacterium]